MSSEKKPLINNYVKTLGFISGIILAISVTVSILNIRDTNKTFLEYETSTILINKLDYVLSTVKDAETGQRGYIITGDKAFLEPFKSAQLHIDKELTELSDLLRSKNVQQELIDSLQILVKRKMRGTLRTKMYAEKIHFTFSDSLRRRLLKGKDTMTKIRQMIRELKAREQARFELKKKEANGKTITSIYIIIISTSASLLIFMLLLFNLNKTVRGQREAEKLLLESQLSLEQQVYKLHLSNKELEQFAYVASHDLQEPLRKIISFNERIQEMLSGNSEIKPYLERMSKSATRMRTLIQDLLNFSRSTKPVNMDETVDLNQLFTTVLEDLDNIIASSRAKIFIDRMPEVKGNSTQLRQLFQNLFSNALKFSKPDEEPYIHITYDQVLASDSIVRNLGDFTPKHETYLLISVADNGIGFDPKYAEQIFVIFQRLHGRSEYEGTGIGLSVVKKIIENHGGFITAKSEPGKGATFIVGLPLK